MGTINRHYDPHFKKVYKDKRRNHPEYTPLRYKNKYERRRKHDYLNDCRKEKEWLKNYY